MRKNSKRSNEWDYLNGLGFPCANVWGREPLPKNVVVVVVVVVVVSLLLSRCSCLVVSSSSSAACHPCLCLCLCQQLCLCMHLCLHLCLVYVHVSVCMSMSISSSPPLSSTSLSPVTGSKLLPSPDEIRRPCSVRNGRRQEKKCRVLGY